MDKGQCRVLTIRRMPEGGYLVTRDAWERGLENEPLYASGDIDNALEFIRDQIVPVPAVMSGGMSGGIEKMLARNPAPDAAAPHHPTGAYGVFGGGR